ncbi:nuclear transport factor 2 family protein [Microbacterium rhizomatis]|uniref:Nuclear transport factor 2 family protein n=1 Tax=Microbacterium rhizomatis TaxID=1631477 RepID=A0A5J5J0D0_9MICO|nr:nuclear transport factor 2 family protein [Microbacterium rhizomatis]KAA9106594.1 nuclear transport factor 2 family protein [Microbacterium rhizomatis]
MSDTQIMALRDELSIRDLSHRYALALDRDDRDAWRSLFSDDVVVESGGSVRGLEDVLRIPRDQLARYQKTLHSVTTQHIVLDGDTASGEVYCVAHHLYEDFHQNRRSPFDLSHNFLIRYEDEYARENGRWVFTKRRIITEARYVHQIIPAAPPAV